MHPAASANTKAHAHRSFLPCLWPVRIQQLVPQQQLSLSFFCGTVADRLLGL